MTITIEWIRCKISKIQETDLIMSDTVITTRHTPVLLPIWFYAQIICFLLLKQIELSSCMRFY